MESGKATGQTAHSGGGDTTCTENPTGFGKPTTKMAHLHGKNITLESNDTSTKSI
jgi:hypothetical protein